MTTDTVPAPVPVEPTDAGNRPVHLYCCDPNVALCGADISRDPEVPEAANEALCPLCEVIDNRNQPCGAACQDTA